ncbi:hypothetical protein SLA2020_332300 [Shorea laevis]
MRRLILFGENLLISGLGWRSEGEGVRRVRIGEVVRARRAGDLGGGCWAGGCSGVAVAVEIVAVAGELGFAVLKSKFE